MKKVLALVLALSLVFMLVSCGNISESYAKKINADGTEGDVPAGIAFYSTPVGGTLGYYFNPGSTVTFNTLNIEKGQVVLMEKVLPFQISSSNYKGLYPVTVRMKLKTIFYL